MYLVTDVVLLQFKSVIVVFFNYGEQILLGHVSFTCAYKSCFYLVNIGINVYILNGGIQK
jgi:hypothetical protein